MIVSRNVEFSERAQDFQTRSGEPLFAYRTAATPFHPSLVVYLTVSGNYQNVVVQGFLLPVPQDDCE